MLDIDALNKFSDAADDVKVCWMMAANANNTDTLKYRFHTHNFYEIHFVLSGHIIYGFEDKTVLVKCGEYIVVPPMLAHRVMEHSEDFVKLTVAFEERGEKSLDFGSGIPSVFKTTEEMTAEIGEIAARTLDSRAYTQEVISSILLKLVLLVIEITARTQPKIPKKMYDGRVLRAKRLIEDNDNIFFTASEIAIYCGISLKQLGRLFKLYENKGVLEYIHEKKTEDAKARVAESGETFEVISKSLGFADVSYFNKFFQKNTGLTPGEYRRVHSLL